MSRWGQSWHRNTIEGTGVANDSHLWSATDGGVLWSIYYTAQKRTWAGSQRCVGNGSFGSPRPFPFPPLTLGHRWWSDITVLVCKNGGSVIRPSGAPLSIIAPDIVQRAFAKMDFHSKLVDAKFQLGVHFNLRDKQTETLKYLFHGRDCIGRSDVSAA